MCMKKDSTLSKIDRLIEQIDRLASVLERMWQEPVQPSGLIGKSGE